VCVRACTHAHVHTCLCECMRPVATRLRLAPSCPGPCSPLMPTSMPSRHRLPGFWKEILLQLALKMVPRSQALIPLETSSHSQLQNCQHYELCLFTSNEQEFAHRAALVTICTSGADLLLLLLLPTSSLCSHPLLGLFQCSVCIGECQWVTFLPRGGVQRHISASSALPHQIHCVRLPLCCHLSQGNNTPWNTGGKVQLLLPHHQHSPLTSWANTMHWRALLSEQPSEIASGNIISNKTYFKFFPV